MVKEDAHASPEAIKSTRLVTVSKTDLESAVRAGVIQLDVATALWQRLKANRGTNQLPDEKNLFSSLYGLATLRNTLIAFAAISFIIGIGTIFEQLLNSLGFASLGVASLSLFCMTLIVCEKKLSSPSENLEKRCAFTLAHSIVVILGTLSVWAFTSTSLLLTSNIGLDAGSFTPASALVSPSQILVDLCGMIISASLLVRYSNPLLIYGVFIFGASVLASLLRYILGALIIYGGNYEWAEAGGVFVAIALILSLRSLASEKVRNQIDLAINAATIYLAYNLSKIAPESYPSLGLYAAFGVASFCCGIYTARRILMVCGLFAMFYCIIVTTWGISGQTLYGSAMLVIIGGGFALGAFLQPKKSTSLPK